MEKEERKMLLIKNFFKSGTCNCERYADSQNSISLLAMNGYVKIDNSI